MRNLLLVIALLISLVPICTAKVEVHYGLSSAVEEDAAVCQFSLNADNLAEVEALELGVTENGNLLKGVDLKRSFTQTDANTYLLRYVVSNLRKGKEYLAQLSPKGSTMPLATLQFKTLQGASGVKPARMVVSSCMHYERFYGIEKIQAGVGPKAAKLSYSDSAEGFPALVHITALRPDIWVNNGDNVYYDHPVLVKNTSEMRDKWHRQLSMPRFRKASMRIGTWWTKDDHDYRTDDSDTTDARTVFPTHAIGKAVFREQAPNNIHDQLNDKLASNGVTHSFSGKPYHTRRVNKHLQVWTLEGRDFRSPNAAPDNKDKSMWGKQQKEWLFKTIKESNATFKIIISPTPLVGPDDASKNDNHTNMGGFRTEGNEFFEFLKANNLDPSELIIVCGDRHWQYQHVHPSGFHEFSTGSMVTANSRVGRQPGDPNSTDPEAKIKSIFMQPVPTGAFLQIDCTPLKGKKANLSLRFISEDNRLLHQYEVTR